ncbi:MAG: hypothetical protein R3F61_34370 [Myxococcota bacterium]
MSAPIDPSDPGRLPPRQVVVGLLVPMAVSLGALAHVVALTYWAMWAFDGPSSGGGAILGLEGLVLLFGIPLGLATVGITALVHMGLALTSYRSGPAATGCVTTGLTVALGLFDVATCGGYGVVAFGEVADAVLIGQRAQAHEEWRAETLAIPYRSEALGVSFSYLADLPPHETYQRPRISVREEGGHLLIVGEREEGPMSVYARLTTLEVPADTPVVTYLQSLAEGDGCTLDDVSSESWREEPMLGLAARHPVYGLHLGATYGCRMPKSLDGSPIFGGPVPFDFAQLEGRYDAEPPPVSEESSNVYFVVGKDRVWVGMFDGYDPPYGPGILEDPVVEGERYWVGTLRFE